MDTRTRQKVELETLHGLLDELSYYQILLLDPECGPDEVEPAFRRESRSRHPDRVGRLGDRSATRQATAIYKLINEAYRVLRDPDKRRAYDHELSRGLLRLSEDGAADAKSAGQAAADPAAAARTEKGAKYWRLALQNWRDEDYSGCVMNIQFALSFEKDNEVFQQYLADAKEKAKDQKSQKNQNPYKLRF
ncbi:MAG: DnaJ domain-containing protein [Myxococcota bacterium]|nr:DnaJ domain-containing protein [Myxococcota bacterium]